MYESDGLHLIYEDGEEIPATCIFVWKKDEFQDHRNSFDFGNAGGKSAHFQEASSVLNMLSLRWFYGIHYI